MARCDDEYQNMRPISGTTKSVYVFKYMFSVFKQYYTYFYTLFHPHVFLKNINNVTITTLPNRLQIILSYELDLMREFLFIYLLFFLMNDLMRELVIIQFTFELSRTIKEFHNPR